MVDIVAENIIHGDDNVIIGNHTNPYIHPSTSTLSDGSPSERPCTVVCTQDLVIGDRNHISKGQTSKALPPRSCPTDTNGTTSQQGNLMKKHDDKDYTHNREIVAKASRSVGILPGPGRLTGTGFRVVDRCLMPALHVVDNIIRAVVFVMVWIYTYFEDIVYDHRKQISKGQTSKEVRTRSCSTDTNDERSNRVYAEDIVHGHQNHISNGQSSKELPPISCPTDTIDERSNRVYAEDIVHGHRNHISKGQRSKELPPISCPTDMIAEKSNRVEDIVHGHRNRISKEQTSKELPPVSCPTDTNGTTSQQGNLVKKYNDKDYVRNQEIVVKASQSVGIIRGPENSGTGFRVGDCYIMTALHVVDNAMKSFQDDDNKEIDYTKVVYSGFFIEFGYKADNRIQNRSDIFSFIDLVYKNKDLDTAILKLCPKENIAYPPSIGIFAPLIKDKPVYLIGHPEGGPMVMDPKIEIYQYSEEEVNKSTKWAITTGYSDGHYEGINNPRKILFHCACQEGASGALGVMVMPNHDVPVGVLMLLSGYPRFYYLEDKLFSDIDKENFLIVEQGVLLTSIEDDKELDSDLKNQIFGNVILH